jgi:acetaldehyde dehydrogenase (acetylating)
MDKDLESIQEARNLAKLAREAQKSLSEFSQEKIDKIVKKMAERGREEAERLARLACEETKLGVYEDKVTKNKFATETVYEFIKDMKTVGFIREDKDKKLYEIAEPMGVILGIIPTTNPTSTLLYKSLIAIKARNCIIFSPHPRARDCSLESAIIMAEAAESEGAPKGTISCISIPTMQAVNELMRSPDIDLILATGGSAMVKAAYSSGTPAYGVGPGNVPCFVERTANIKSAVSDIFVSKCFDNGIVCSSEQAVIADNPIKEELIEEMKKNGAYFLTKEEANKLAAILIMPTGLVNPELVGQPAQYIAKQVEISVPKETRLLIAELDSVGKDYPLSREKLSPVLAFYTEKDWQNACKRCIELLKFGGLGHTLVIHSNDESVIREFALKKPAFRILVNCPGSQGGIGVNTGLDPALTLGCGTLGGGITADNITPLHLLNIKRLAYPLKRVEVKKRILDGRAAVEIAREEAHPEEKRGLSEKEIESIVEQFLKERGKKAVGV